MEKANQPLIRLVPFGNCEREESIHVHIGVGQLNTFGVLFVERANVEGVGGIHFATWRNQGWSILLDVDLVPVDARKEVVLFDLFGSG